jgi:hypothetical protein
VQEMPGRAAVPELVVLAEAEVLVVWAVQEV